MSSILVESRKKGIIGFVESLKKSGSNQAEIYQSLLESIDESLCTIFGKTAANILSNHLCLRKMSQEDEKFDLRQFSKNLEELLGAGATVIEYEIIRNLSSKLSVKKDDE